jgi:hypothetical protein
MVQLIEHKDFVHLQVLVHQLHLVDLEFLVALFLPVVLVHLEYLAVLAVLYLQCLPLNLVDPVDQLNLCLL